MAAHVFYDPEVVASMRARGITARPRLLSAPATTTSAQPAGFVLARRAGPRAAGGAVVTHVVNVRGNVTITGRAPQAERPRLAASTEPQTALDLAEECARLRRDNQRLVDDVNRLRAEIDRLMGNQRAPSRDGADLDDSARRFSLLELDL